MTEIKFVALATGVLALDALRIVDLATQDAVDIRDLPDIVAVEGKATVGSVDTRQSPEQRGSNRT
jgi:hypothetical protein